MIRPRAAIRSDPAKGVVFLEGSGIGTGDLCLDVCLGSKRCWTASVPIRLTTVENMYNHLNLRPDGEGRSTYTNLPPYCPCPGSTTNLVFLHGFLVTAQEARGWHAKMFKKLHQSGSNARFWGVTWQGDDIGALNYYGNVVNAFNTASNLAARVNAIPGKNVLMAHSLGNMVAAMAIQRHGLQTDKLLALNAAVAAEAFDAAEHSTSRISMVHETWRAYMSRTWASEFHDLFAGTSDWRRNLTWKNRFSAVASKLYNFYSLGDEVLEQYTDGETLWGTTGWFERYAWHKQEHFKGRGLPHGSVYMGWGFQPYNGLTYTADEANLLSAGQLIATPVFLCIPDAVCSPATPPQSTIDLMLAQGVPALSRAAGWSAVSTAKENFDINTSPFRPVGGDWPNTSGDNELRNRWLHNDMKIMAYRYTHKLFDKFVETGEFK